MRRFIMLGMLLLTGAALLWMLSQRPFATPMVTRSTPEIKQALEGAMARGLSPKWLMPRLETALVLDDGHEVQMLAGLATKYGVPLPPEIWDKIDTLQAAPSPTNQDCSACVHNIHACQTLALIAACSRSVQTNEDLEALRQEAKRALAGDTPDPLNTGLLLLGAGASASTNSGANLVLKAGVRTVQTARDMNALLPKFQETLSDAATLPIDWQAILDGAPLAQITDTTKLVILAQIIKDIGTLRAHTSGPEALLLLGYIETPDDAARIARLSTITKGETRAMLGVIGKPQIYDISTRVSDKTLLTIGLIIAFIGQLGLFAVSSLFNRLRRLFHSKPVARR